MKTVCGIDLGTQSCKVIVYDYEAGKVAARSSAPLDMISWNDGTREQKIEWYGEALATCFAAIDRGILAGITAVGVSGQQHGLIALDADGSAVHNVKLWCDTSTAEECAELTEMAGGEERLIAEAGLPMRPGYTAPKLLWLKKRKPDAFARIRRILLPHDYVNFLLSGKCRTECGDASGTALLDVRRRKWASRICALISPELESRLPPLIEPDAPAGFVSQSAAALYGIPAGIPVSAGGGDNMMGAIGTGAVRDGVLTMSLGTSGTLYGFSQTPVIDPSGNLAAFCSSTGGWLPLLCTMNCTVASEEFRGMFGLDLAAFGEEAEKAPAGAEGIIVLPFFNGERTPNLPGGRASVHGITAANFRRGNLFRAAFESAILGMRIGLEEFGALGFKAQEIRLTGGGAKSRLWQSIVADVTNLPVRIPAETESAAMGAAVQALWCLQTLRKEGTSIAELVDEHIGMEGSATVTPDARTVEVYDGVYAEYSRYLETLSPLYK